jgi:hemolysin activation/secretion protein
MKTSTLNGKVLSPLSKSATGWLSVFLLTFFFVAFASPRVYAQASKADLKAAQKVLSSAERQVSGFNKQISKLEKTIKKLDSDIASETAELGKITKKRMTADKATSDKLKKQADKLSSAIATLQGKRSASETQLADLNKQRAAANTQLDAAKTNLAGLKAEAKKPAVKVEKPAKVKVEKPAKVKAEKPAKAVKPAKVKAEKPAKPAPAVVKDQPVTAPWTPATPPDEKPVLKGSQQLATPPAKDGDVAPMPTKIQFDLPMISGDKEIVEGLKVWKDWAEHITFNPVSTDEIKAFQGNLVKALQEQGYVFANVQIPTKIWGYGIFLAKVDCGKLGNITVRNAKNYSPAQIIRALENQEGKFNYAKIHGDLYDLNVKPDLKLDTQLRPTTQGGRRSVDAEIEVEDKLPIHGAIEFANNGYKESNDYRIRTTLQHLNLTKHDDSLTLDWLTGGDIGESLNAFSANYFLPVGDKWSFNVYGGYNESEYDSVLPGLDIVGKGHYVGTQISRSIYESNFERLQLTFGWLYQKTKNHLGVGGQALNKRAIALSMPSITLGYAAKVFDRFGGRNFASITLQRNFAGKYGASDKDDFIENDGAYSEGDFTMAKFQVARLQRLFSGPDAPGKWSLFGKIDAQIADDSVPGAVRDYLGGFNSVRGYEESEIGADNSLVATLELRTPLLQNFIPGLKKDEKFLADNPKYWGQHRLQFVAFTDFGYVDNKEPYAGELDNQDMLSVGLGLRLGLTNYSQMSVDYGYPLIDASDHTPSDGRFHVSIQLQF